MHTVLFQIIVCTTWILVKTDILGLIWTSAKMLDYKSLPFVAFRESRSRQGESSIFSGLLIGYNDDYNDPYWLERSPYAKQGTKNQVPIILYV